MMSIREIKEELKKELSSSRYEHTMGVEYTAACLAMRHGCNVDKARLAGLLHDCAKGISTERKIAMCEEAGLDVRPVERENPELLHAKLGAYLARIRYNIEDEEILSSITWHTTGKPGMNLLEKIIFIADYIEPNRDRAPHLTELRQMAFCDLDACLLAILEDMNDYLKEQDATCDPLTWETYLYYKNM